MSNSKFRKFADTGKVTPKWSNALKIEFDSKLIVGAGEFCVRRDANKAVARIPRDQLADLPDVLKRHVRSIVTVGRDSQADYIDPERVQAGKR